MGWTFGSAHREDIFSVQLLVRGQLCVVRGVLWLYCQWFGCFCAVSSHVRRICIAGVSFVGRCVGIGWSVFVSCDAL